MGRDGLYVPYTGGFLTAPVQSEVSFKQLKIIPLVYMHHGDAVLVSPEAIDTIHILNQGLKALVRDADNQL